jgi:hypothetical protein
MPNRSGGKSLKAKKKATSHEAQWVGSVTSTCM